MAVRSIALGSVLIPLLAGVAAAQGLVIPNEPDLPPLALRKHKVRVEISRQGATTTVEQTFLNNTERRLEAQYVFPIPKGAAMSRFTMLVNGKETRGELVEKTQARSIYNSMVNRMQEPGLLEYVGSEVFRANIFPIEPHGEQVITIRFEQVLPAESGLVRYVYPVRPAGKTGPTVHGEFSIQITIADETPLQNIYSPSHSIDIARASEREARVSFSEKHATLERDFQVYYSVGNKDVGLDLVTFRPDPAKPGYFMMLVSPRSKLQAERWVERDVVFVVDTSGSMAGEKIKQARNALKYCVSKLGDRDRFNIVQFSTDVTPWKKDLVSASESREAAMAFADTLIAQGGTAIADALESALSFPKNPSRPYFVIFLTDGRPTIGNTKDQAILGIARAGRKDHDQVRVFTWGVGYDVDTHLLDGIAETAGGVSEYVHPEEDIATKVASFYGKTSHPVLTGVEMKAIGDKIQLVNMQPSGACDLYAGSQLVVFGRYTGSGDAALRLTGRVNDKTETFDYEARFPDSSPKNGFIETLWARRQIGHLLTAIRLHGETKELVDDVVRLSIEYGIQTPYTSYLVTGETPQARGEGGRIGKVVIPGPAADPAAKDKLDHLAQKPQGSTPAEPPSARAQEDRKRELELSKALDEDFEKKGGKSGVDAASYIRRLKEAERPDEGKMGLSKKASGVRFFEYRSIWVDERFDGGCEVTRVKFGSDAYFKILDRRPELVEMFKIGTSVLIVTAKGKALLIGSEGEASLADSQVDALFR
jgi:Ca-activated chloride channel family protein